MNSNSEPIKTKLKKFRLSGMANSLDIRLKEAQSSDLSYSDFLELLLEDEVDRRTDNRKKRLYKNARLPFEKSFDNFEFTFQPSIKKKQLMELATCKFMDSAENVIFVGQPGTGKTHLSVALALQALGRDKTVLFATVWDMINDLESSRADLSYQKRMKKYLQPDLLILDELGYRSMANKTVEDFFEIVSRRYEKGSIIMTSNRDISDWGKIFIDKTLTGAILDRLVHHCSVITITGESYRVKGS